MNLRCHKRAGCPLVKSVDLAKLLGCDHDPFATGIARLRGRRPGLKRSTQATEAGFDITPAGLLFLEPIVPLPRGRPIYHGALQSLFRVWARSAPDDYETFRQAMHRANATPVAGMPGLWREIDAWPDDHVAFRPTTLTETVQ